MCKFHVAEKVDFPDDKPYTRRILSHSKTPPHAVAVETLIILVDRNYELPANKANLNKAKLHMETHMHTYIDTYEREGLLNPGTVGLKETLWYFRLEHTLSHCEAKRVPLLPYSVMVGLGGSKRDPRVPHPVTVGLLRLRRDAVAPHRHCFIHTDTHMRI